MQMPVAHNMLESEMIGAIKIKDGLFIGDELASTVSHQPPIIDLIDTLSRLFCGQLYRLFLSYLKFFLEIICLGAFAYTYSRSHIINGFYLNPNVHWWWPHETGDNFLLQDLEFVVANKVTHIINCAGKQIQNHWEPIGVAYLTFFWLDQDNQVSKTNSTNIHFEQSKPFSVVSLPSLHECRFYWTLEIRKTRPRTLSLNLSRRPLRPQNQF